jgi:hypothetical protein
VRRAADGALAAIEFVLPKIRAGEGGRPMSAAIVLQSNILLIVELFDLVFRC